MSADTTTRADDVQKWSELDGVSLFVANLLHAIDETHDRKFIQAITWDGMTVNDDTSSESELFETLWPADDDYEDRPEWHTANAHSLMVSAGILQWLATDEGRDYCARDAMRALEAARDALRRAEAANRDA